MRNKGYVTVFVTLLIAALLLIFTVVYKIVDISAARSRSSMALKTACSSVKAEWTNEYIFDHYHILLIDMSAGGSGESGLADEIKASMEENLGEGYSVENVSISGRTGILDDDCDAFKEQIRDYALYGLTKFAADKLMEKTEGKDKPISDESIAAMDKETEGISDEEPEQSGQVGNQNSGQSAGQQPGQGQNQGSGQQPGLVQALTTEDPRKEVRRVKKAGVYRYILPEDTEFSETSLDLKTLPSYGKRGLAGFAIESNFDSYLRLKKDMNKGSGWLEGLAAGGEALAYAHGMFNSLTEKRNDDTVLNLELEYIIAGKETDAENYKKVINQIIAIRFACNFAYILTDVEKMAEVNTLAITLTIFFPFMQPVVKYLLAGCWAYVEGVADAYCLVRGKKIPYIKSRESWKTSLDGISKLAEVADKDSGCDEKSGMDYNDYLMILMALHIDTAYLRMLDIMQVNAAQQTPGFSMREAAVALGADAEVSYKEGHFTLHSEDGY